MVSGTISTQSCLKETHWIKWETNQGPVEARESKEDEPKIDLGEVRNKVLNKLFEHIDRQVKRVKRKVSEPKVEKEMEESTRREMR